MRILATHVDGFTEHLLHWRLEIVDGRADLDAKWFARRSPRSTTLAATFAVDEAPIRSALPWLDGMDESYAAPMDDLDTLRLLVEDGPSTIRRSVEGAGILVATRPEIRRFLAFWGLLQRAIAGSLPSGLDP